MTVENSSWQLMAPLQYSVVWKVLWRWRILPDSSWLHYSVESYYDSGEFFLTAASQGISLSLQTTECHHHHSVTAVFKLSHALAAFLFKSINQLVWCLNLICVILVFLSVRLLVIRHLHVCIFFVYVICHSHIQYTVYATTIAWLHSSYLYYSI